MGWKADCISDSSLELRRADSVVFLPLKIAEEGVLWAIALSGAYSMG